MIEAVRPSIRYFHSSQYISDLANGEIFVAVGYFGDIFIAADRAVEAENGIEVAYTVPKEGAQQSFDMMAIPADAPNPEAAHAFLNFVMEPQITADITNYVWYANARRLDAAGRPRDRERPGDLPAGRGAREAVPDGDARRANRPADHPALDAREDGTMTRRTFSAELGERRHRAARRAEVEGGVGAIAGDEVLPLLGRQAQVLAGPRTQHQAAVERGRRAALEIVVAVGLPDCRGCAGRRSGRVRPPEGRRTAPVR